IPRRTGAVPLHSVPRYRGEAHGLLSPETGPAAEKQGRRQGDPRTLAALKNAAAPLIFTEGEKKAAKSDQEGFPCIGLIGVSGWQKKRAKDKHGKPQGQRHLLDALAAIPWQGRLVYVCFDSDASTNPNVRKAEWHLAEALVLAGALVKIVRLLAGEPGSDG